MNKVAKKLICLCLFIMVFSFMCIGCSNINENVKSDENTGSDKEKLTSTSNDTEKSEIEFWYHDANPTSIPIFEELIKRFEEENPQYKVKFVGLPNDSYLLKYNTAIATNTVPDISSIRDMDVTNLVSQDALVSLDDAFNAWEEKDMFTSSVIDAVRNTTLDGKIYVLPQYTCLDISWYNKKLMDEKGIEPPKTINDFLNLCEKYADPENGKYFYSLRGGDGSMENLVDFIFTYAGEDNFFDEEGNCIINGDKFVEGLEKYASIYWNGWVPKDDVTNSFKEMVSEFGSETAMFINHNSSSLPEHQKNLGEGNFMNIVSPANEEGKVTTKGISYVGYGVYKDAKNVEGGIALAKYLTSHEGASYLCENEGRIPVNSSIYEDDWYKNDKYLKTYEKIMNDPNTAFLDHPIWLTEWNEFRNTIQVADLQAVLLQKKTAKEVLDSWAKLLTEAQKEYLKAK